MHCQGKESPATQWSDEVTRLAINQRIFRRRCVLAPQGFERVQWKLGNSLVVRYIIYGSTIYLILIFLVR